MLTALKIDPYTRTAALVQLTPPPEPPHLSLHECVAAGSFVSLCADRTATPRSHWLLFDPLVHERRPDERLRGPPLQFDHGVRDVYRSLSFRGSLWCREDVPDAGSPARLALPSFCFKDGVQPGALWCGVSYLVLYERGQPAALREPEAFLERTREACLSWLPLEGFPTLSRLVLRFGEDNLVTSSKTCAVCMHCKEHARDAKLCTGCLRCFYCSEACQRRHWRAEHKRVCRP